MLDWILLAVTLLLLYRWLDRKPANFPPGPPTVPLLGSAPLLKYTHLQFLLEELREKYGPIIGFKFGPHPAIAVCGPDEVIEVLKSDIFMARPSLIMRSRIKNPTPGFFAGNGEKWKLLRRFVLRHLRDFGFGKRTVNDMVQLEATEFFDYALKGKSTIEVTGLFSKSSNNVLWAMIAGDRLAYDDEEGQLVMETAAGFLRQGIPAGGGMINYVPYLREFVSLFYELRDDRLTRIMDTFILKTINNHKKTKTSVPRDLIDAYLDEMEKPDLQWAFNEKILTEACKDLLMAGSDSSSNTLSFCIMYFLLYPEWQDKLFNEIDATIGNRSPVYEDDRQNLPHVEAFLNEVIRCNTIAPLAAPHAPVQDTTFHGYTVAKDTFMTVSIWCLLQDKKHWGDPENFRPERFIGADGKCIRDPYISLAFSTGARHCIGESLALRFTFLFLIHMVQRFKFSLPKGSPKPSTLSIPGFTNAPQTFWANLSER